MLVQTILIFAITLLALTAVFIAIFEDAHIR